MTDRRYYEWTPPERVKHDPAVVAGTWLVLLSALLWPLALPAFVMGAIAASRRHTTAGVLIMVLSVLSGFVSLLVVSTLL